MVEREALQNIVASAALLASLGTAALFAMLRNKWLAGPTQAERRFEEEPPDRVLTLDL